MNNVEALLLLWAIIGYAFFSIFHLVEMTNAHYDMEYCFPLAIKAYSALNKFTAFGRWFLTIPVIILELPFGIVAIVVIVVVKGIHNIFVKEKW